MILVYVWLIICLVVLLMLALFHVNVMYQFKCRHPGVKIPKHHWAGEIFTAVKCIMTCIFPIYPMCWLYKVVTNTKTLTEEVIEDLCEKYSNKENNNEK